MNNYRSNILGGVGIGIILALGIGFHFGIEAIKALFMIFIIFYLTRN